MPIGAQDLGRAYNNLGTSWRSTAGGSPKAATSIRRPCDIHEDLARREPTNREYAMELVQFYNNLSATLRDNGELDEAIRRNLQARERIESLARPAPSVSIERADSYSLQGLISEGRSRTEAASAYQRSLDLFTTLGRDESTWRFPEFHERFGDLLVSLADMAGTSNAPAIRGLLAQGLRDYAAIAERSVGGAAADTRVVRDTLTRVRATLDGEAATILDGALAKLQP